MKKELIIGLAGGFVAGAAAGAFGAYAFLNQKYARTLNATIDAISEEISKDYARFYAGYIPKPDLEEVSLEGEEERLETALKLVKQTKAERDEILEDMDYNGTEEDPEDPVTQEKNIFEDEEQRLIKKLSAIDPLKPYLITVEQFMDPYEEHGKLSLTYFEEDGVLIEEQQETIIDNPDLIGSEVLAAFGHDPRDKDTIHVRNEVIGADLEVTRDRRSYAEVIAGYKEPEEKPHVRKPRREDDDR